MRFLLIIIAISYFTSVFCRNDVREISGPISQDVIQLRGSSKDLEGESSENEDDSTSGNQQVGTKKAATLWTSVKNGKDNITDTLNQEEEEARVEKELADMYKDNLDYKAESGEMVKGGATDTSATIFEKTVKPIRRIGGGITNDEDIKTKMTTEKTKVSVKEIDDKEASKNVRNVTVVPPKIKKSMSSKIAFDIILLGLTLIVAKN